MSTARVVDVSPIERAAGQVEALQRLLASQALAAIFLLVRNIPDKFDPNQIETGRKDLNKALPGLGDTFSEIMTSLPFGLDFRALTVGMDVVFLGGIVAFLMVAMTSSRWLLGALAFWTALTFGFYFLWQSFFFVTVVHDVFAGVAAARTPEATRLDYALLTAQRFVWALIAGAAAYCAGTALLALVRRPQRDLELMRTQASGGLLSLRRLFAVFDIPLLFARPARGRALRVTLMLLAAGLSAWGISFWLDAPSVLTALDVVMLADCDANEPNNVLHCTAFSVLTGPSGPPFYGLERTLFGYIVFPAMGVLVGAALINVVKRVSPAPPSSLDEAPILFLRAFENDQGRIRPRRGGLLTMMMDFGRAPDSIDQLLVYDFGARAPVIALGKPGEKRPPFGAHRIYADHKDWRVTIEDLFARAKVVILVVDRSEGLLWETRQCLYRPDLRAKTLFLMRRREDYDFLLGLVGAGALGVSLPPSQAAIAAYSDASGWTLLHAQRPTRISYQLCARRFLQERVSL